MNQVTLTFKDAYGKSYEQKSNVVNITIREIYTAKLMSIAGTTQKAPADGGTKVFSIVKIHNTGNKDDTYQLSAVNNIIHDSINAGDILIYRDTNGNGQLDANEMTPITSIDLDADESASLIIVTLLPQAIAESDTLIVDLSVTSDNGATIDQTITEIKITFSEKTTVTTPVFAWEQKNGGNCHTYTSIDLPANADGWAEAKIVAEESVYQGLHGHLATLNTYDEIQFVKTIINKSENHWIGGLWNGTNWVWDTGEPSYIGTDGSIQNTFPQFVWATNGWNAGQQYAYIWKHTADGKWATHDNVWGEDANGNPVRAFVEFDIDCPMPNVDLPLTAAKDVACDGVADSSFDALDLTEMAPGECAIMHIRAKNTSSVEAIDIFLKQEMPNYLSYVPNTITSCGFDDACSLEKRADNEADKDDGYYDSVNNSVVIGGKPTNLKPGDVIHGEYLLKID